MKKQKLQKQPEFLAEIKFWMKMYYGNIKKSVARAKRMMGYKMKERRGKYESRIQNKRLIRAKNERT